jgi:prophage maintenance system killer protein
VENIDYLTVADIIAIYERAMLESDQVPAALVREDALQRAVHHPRNLAWYQAATLGEQAVDLALELALAHAWVDGNKRVSMRSFEVFLELNGIHIPDADYRPFTDAFVATVGAKPEDRLEYVGLHVDMVQRWIDQSEDT